MVLIARQQTVVGTVVDNSGQPPTASQSSSDYLVGLDGGSPAYLVGLDQQTCCIGWACAGVPTACVQRWCRMGVWDAWRDVALG